MSEDINEILDKLEIVAIKRTIEVREDGSKIETMPACLVYEYRLNNYSAKILLDYITNLQEENERLNNIINGMEKFFQYAYDNEVRPLDDRKVSVWTICLDKLQELKGSDK